MKTARRQRVHKETLVLYLHKSDSGHQHEQREPLVGTQLFPQHGDRKQSRGENFQLVRDLCEGQPQIAPVSEQNS